MLAACSSFETAGEPAGAFVTPALRDAYLPLHVSTYVVLEERGAGIVILPGVAVTNAHNSDLIDKKSVIGISRNFDLMFFRVAAGTPPPIMAPHVGEDVFAYGQGADNELRVAHGVIRGTDVEMPLNCDGCEPAKAIAFEADAGHGFSGGPLVDAKTGALLGIVFGFRKSDEAQKERMMYAYSIERVMRELALLRNGKPG